jgi:hypothetical protein
LINTFAQPTATLPDSATEAAPDWLRSLLEHELGIVDSGLPLAGILARPSDYDRRVALQLIDSARGRGGVGWAERLLAVLLLENRILRISPTDLAEFDFLFVQLGLKPNAGAEVPLIPGLLDEGYRSISLAEFANEFRRRLGRFNRVHECINIGAPSCEAWRYLLRVSREACKLTMARYFFQPAEVVEQARRAAVMTQGAEHTLARVHAHPDFVCRAANLHMPAFEREILNRLTADHNVYWVTEATSSELNSPIEYPLTSAVLVVKPPGSDLEFEIKRAGVRGPRKLDVVYQSNGKPVPVSHSLHGGSLGWLGRRESRGSAIFAEVYGLVHGKECPCSRTVSIASIVGVPTSRGERHILDYLTDRDAFGAGFEETRLAMADCVKAQPSDTGISPASYGGEMGLTLQYIGQAQPQQATIFNSSSYRLDRIAAYLSDDGPEEYFRVGLGRDYSPDDARWLADTVLEEILGSVVRPASDDLNDSTHGAYLRSAFLISENRRRADETYLSLMRQIGECWGTLLAVRGYSDGESFVLRNVGLKSQWRDGDWRVRIIFMDHDDLVVPGIQLRHFHPSRAVPGMMRDQAYVFGGPLAGSVIEGECGALAKIYRVGDELSETGMNALRRELAAAYHKTQSAMTEDAELRALFFPEFLERLGDFDRLVAKFLQTDAAFEMQWKSQAAAYLSEKNYPDDLTAQYVQVIPQFRRFFERMAFLYSSR